MEATICDGERGLNFGDFNRFVDTIVAIRAPTVGGRNIDLIAKSHRSTAVRFGDKFRGLPTETKERFVDMIVDLFALDITAERAKSIWNGMLDIKEVGSILRSLDSEFKKFNAQQRIAIEKESIDLSLEELEEVELDLERCLLADPRSGSEDIMVAIQTIYLCRLALAWVRSHIERKGSLDKSVMQVQLIVLMSLARLDSYRRGKTQRYWIYDDLSVLSYLLKDEEPAELLLRSGAAG